MVTHIVAYEAYFRLSAISHEVTRNSTIVKDNILVPGICIVCLGCILIPLSRPLLILPLPLLILMSLLLVTGYPWNLLGTSHLAVDSSGLVLADNNSLGTLDSPGNPDIPDCMLETHGTDIPDYHGNLYTLDWERGRAVVARLCRRPLPPPKSLPRPQTQLPPRR